MILVDVHSHLCDNRYDGTEDEIVESFLANGGELMINSGFDIPSSVKSAGQAEKYGCVYFSAGVHPDEAKTFDKDAEKTFIELAKRDKCVAIGETGYDFYWNKSTEEEQTRAFERQVEIADDLGKPFVVHSREAHRKTVDFLKRHKSVIKRGFLLHCYAGSAESVKEIADLGGYFSFGGVITFRNAKKEEVIKAIPQDRILTETDCPYLTPEPFRGTTNKPENVKYVLKKIAAVKGEDEEFTAKYIRENAKRLFGV